MAGFNLPPGVSAGDIPGNQFERAVSLTARERKRARRASRKAARSLIRAGTFMNPGKAPVGSTPWTVAQWHLKKARNG